MTPNPEDQSGRAVNSSADALASETCATRSEGRFQRPTLDEEIARFREALAALPSVAARHAAGQQFNAYHTSGDEDDLDMVVCIGPITSRPISLVEADEPVARLVEAALRVAGCAAQPTDPSGKHQFDGADDKTPEPTPETGHG